MFLDYRMRLDSVHALIGVTPQYRKCTLTENPQEVVREDNRRGDDILDVVWSLVVGRCNDLDGTFQMSLKAWCR